MHVDTPHVRTHKHTHMHTRACTNVTNEKAIVGLITWIPFLQRWSTCPNCVEGGSFTVLTQYYQPRKLTLGWQRPASGNPASILPVDSIQPRFPLHWRHHSLVILLPIAAGRDRLRWTNTKFGGFSQDQLFQSVFIQLLNFSPCQWWGKIKLWLIKQSVAEWSSHL